MNKYYDLYSNRSTENQTPYNNQYSNNNRMQRPQNIPEEAPNFNGNNNSRFNVNYNNYINSNSNNDLIAFNNQEARNFSDNQNRNFNNENNRVNTNNEMNEVNQGVVSYYDRYINNFKNIQNCEDIADNNSNSRNEEIFNNMNLKSNPSINPNEYNNESNYPRENNINGNVNNFDSYNNDNYDFRNNYNEGPYEADSPMEFMENRQMNSMANMQGQNMQMPNMQTQNNMQMPNMQIQNNMQMPNMQIPNNIPNNMQMPSNMVDGMPRGMDNGTHNNMLKDNDMHYENYNNVRENMPPDNMGFRNENFRPNNMSMRNENFIPNNMDMRNENFSNNGVNRKESYIPNGMNSRNMNMSPNNVGDRDNYYNSRENRGIPNPYPKYNKEGFAPNRNMAYDNVNTKVKNFSREYIDLTRDGMNNSNFNSSDDKRNGSWGNRGKYVELDSDEDLPPNLSSNYFDDVDYINDNSEVIDDLDYDNSNSYEMTCGYIYGHTPSEKKNNPPKDMNKSYNGDRVITLKDGTEIHYVEYDKKNQQCNTVNVNELGEIIKSNSIDVKVNKEDSVIRSDLIVEKTTLIRVWGRVKDSWGSPIQGAIVSILKPSDVSGELEEQCCATSITDYMGFYEFEVENDYKDIVYRIMVNKSINR